jgi:hypothetical protein
MSKELEQGKLYEDALTKVLNAQKHFPSIDHGPEPSPKDYQVGEWLAGKIRERTIREHTRTV